MIKSMLTEDNNGVSQTSFTFQRQFITTSNSGGFLLLVVQMKHLMFLD